MFSSCIIIPKFPTPLEELPKRYIKLDLLEAELLRQKHLIIRMKFLRCSGNVSYKSLFFQNEKWIRCLTYEKQSLSLQHRKDFLLQVMVVWQLFLKGITKVFMNVTITANLGAHKEHIHTLPTHRLETK